jgi:hypothetical protein
VYRVTTGSDTSDFSRMLLSGVLWLKGSTSLFVDPQLSFVKSVI